MALDVGDHHLFVEVRDPFDHRLTPTTRVGDVVLGDVALGGRRVAVGAEEPGALTDQIDHALEVVLRTDRNLHRNRRHPQPLADHLHRPPVVGPDPIHLVDKADPRHFVLIGLAPDRLRLRLDAGYRIKHHNATVEHPQRAFHFNGEVHVTRCIDDVDRVIVPLAGRRRGHNRDPAFPLLVHEVHHRSTVVHLTDLVRDPGVVEDPLGHGRLARVDMRDHADVAE